MQYIINHVFDDFATLYGDAADAGAGSSGKVYGKIIEHKVKPELLPYGVMAGSAVEERNGNYIIIEDEKLAFDTRLRIAGLLDEMFGPDFALGRWRLDVWAEHRKRLTDSGKLKTCCVLNGGEPWFRSYEHLCSAIQDAIYDGYNCFFADLTEWPGWTLADRILGVRKRYGLSLLVFVHIKTLIFNKGEDKYWDQAYKADWHVMDDENDAEKNNLFMVERSQRLITLDNRCPETQKAVRRAHRLGCEVHVLPPRIYKLPNI